MVPSVTASLITEHMGRLKILSWKMSMRSLTSCLMHTSSHMLMSDGTS
jgi:hypothetical protein